MRISRIATGFAITATMATMSLAVAAPASAAVPSPATTVVAACPTPDFKGNGIRIRRSPHLTARIDGHGNRCDGLIDHGWTTGDGVECSPGWVDYRWHDITNRRTGVRGWVSICFTTL